ncbi:PIN domain-containing protein [Geoglobus acetivorans]|uniref:Putative nucleic acid-binding protein, containing PIN domain n=1 Tax=Geoglobus acetivorans TaxID=565033 RepID=A0A0A7GGX3_GEOAI|nr:putative nucleic acid-binding protein, containing PIN domain [Geoglobus acetivorans]
MKLVVDSNILFSIVVSGERSKAYEGIRNHSLILYFPEEGLLEFRKHKNKLEEHSEEFELRSFIAFSLVHVIPFEVYRDKISEAYTIAREFDERDTPFIALALKLGIPVWSGDRKMIEYGQNSGKFRAIDTASLKNILAEQG